METMKQRTSVGTVKSRGKVLAVDDSETMRMMVRQTLEYGGYQATVAPDGAQALQIFDQDNFDLVITDINMPGMDGLTLVRELRKRNQDVPILTLTTESEEALKRQGAEAGANGWIVKPLIPAQLLDLLGQILDRN